MDLLDLEPEENEADFLFEDLSGKSTALPTSSHLNAGDEDLLDQVFGADDDAPCPAPSFDAHDDAPCPAPSFDADNDAPCPAPSFGDDLCLDGAPTGQTTTTTTTTNKGAADEFTFDDQADEGFDIFEDANNAGMGNIECFGEGPNSNVLGADSHEAPQNEIGKMIDKKK